MKKENCIGLQKIKAKQKNTKKGMKILRYKNFEIYQIQNINKT